MTFEMNLISAKHPWHPREYSDPLALGKKNNEKKKIIQLPTKKTEQTEPSKTHKARIQVVFAYDDQ